MCAGKVSIKGARVKNAGRGIAVFGDHDHIEIANVDFQDVATDAIHISSDALDVEVLLNQLASIEAAIAELPVAQQAQAQQLVEEIRREPKSAEVAPRLERLRKLGTEVGVKAFAAVVVETAKAAMGL
jgi:hypothetical protein